jgi:hypothetical protein
MPAPSLPPRRARVFHVFLAHVFACASIFIAMMPVAYRCLFLRDALPRRCAACPLSPLPPLFQAEAMPEFAGLPMRRLFSAHISPALAFAATQRYARLPRQEYAEFTHISFCATPLVTVSPPPLMRHFPYARRVYASPSPFAASRAFSFRLRAPFRLC